MGHLPEQLHIRRPGVQLSLPPPCVQSDDGGYGARRGSERALEAGRCPDSYSQALTTHLPCCAVVSVRLGLQSLQWPGRGQRVQRSCRA